MKRILFCMGLVLSYGIQAQNTTITYQHSSEVFANPERGLYKYQETKSSSYSLLNESTLAGYRNNQKITLIYRIFYLNTFINAPISQAYLTNMQTDFNRMRNAGIKGVIRFAYSDNESASPRDATKTRMLEHISQLGPVLQANADVIAVLQAGFIGTWGEWYYTSQPEFGGWGYNQKNLTSENHAHRRDILNALLDVLPGSRMVQIRYPKGKQDMYGTTAPLQPSQAYTNTYLARVGHHNDCFLSSANDVGTYSNITLEYPYVEQETKYVVMGGETCALFAPRTSCDTALYEMARLHWSYLNTDYHPDVINGFVQNSCYDDIERRLGYRFYLIQGIFPQSITTNILPINFQVVNEGFAAPYTPRKAFIVLKNTSNASIYKVALTADPRFWQGGTTTTVNENLNLPSGIPNGSYQLFLQLPDSSSSITNRPEYAIRLANQAVWDNTTGYNNLNHTVTISQGQQPQTYSLTTNVNPSGSGTITRTPNASGYASGTVVTLTATPNAGYNFTGWGGGASGTNPTTTVTMNANKTVTANFSVIPVTYTLTTTANPTAGGSVTGGGTYNSGTVATLTATPNAGYNFTGWSGAVSGTSPTITVTMNGNKTVTANFTLQSGTNTTIRIEDNAGPTGGLCLYEGSVTSNSGANNGKVINLTNSTAKGINWRVQVPTAGTYNLVWRYTNGSTSNTFTMALLVNGITVNGAVAFPKTNGTSVFLTTSATVTLNAGYNIIRLQSVQNKATADIDWIEITGNSPVAANCSASRFSNVVAGIMSAKSTASIYPNPVKDKAVINLQMVESAKISVKIFDIYGRLIKDAGSRTLVKGSHQLDLNLENILPGVYTVSITKEDGMVQPIKLVVR